MLLNEWLTIWIIGTGDLFLWNCCRSFHKLFYQGLILHFVGDSRSAGSQAFLRGCGESVARGSDGDFDSGVREIMGVSEEFRSRLFEGYGKGAVWWDAGRGEIARSMIEKVPQEYRGDFEHGIALAAYKD